MTTITLNATDTQPEFDPKDYEIEFLKLRNEQLRRRIAVLEEQLAQPCDCEWRPAPK